MSSSLFDRLVRCKKTYHAGIEYAKVLWKIGDPLSSTASVTIEKEITVANDAIVSHHEHRAKYPLCDKSKYLRANYQTVVSLYWLPVTPL